MSGDDHSVEIPSWNCRVCRDSWPCAPARDQLAAEMQGTDLLLFMAMDMVRAARDNPTIPASELFHRFIAWARLTRPTRDSRPTQLSAGG